MSKPLAKGIYRERCDVVGPLGLARVERVADPEPYNERYTVRLYAREAPSGEVVATCWRYGVGGICEGCRHNKHYGGACTIAQCSCRRGALLVQATGPRHYDGGWTRALAIAEDYTLGSAEDGYRA